MAKSTIKYYHAGIYSYYSQRYNRSITVPDRYPSDGATGAVDIDSKSWWVHDVMCDRGTWDDGSPITNWQASCVISDILYDEGRWTRSLGWLVATFSFGGGECRKNGMFRLKNPPSQGP
jgi:hypothetical protein